MTQHDRNLPHRRLGTQGLEVGAVGLGTMGMTMAYGASDEQSSIATLRRAYELGVTLFDTAELYGMGTGSNEELLGRAVKDVRDDVVLATKFGFDLSGGTAGAGGRIRPGQPPRAHPRGHREQPAPPGHRPHRRALSAPGRPGRTHRGRRRNGGR